MHIPSEREIRRRFAADITLPAWRTPFAEAPTLTMTGPARLLWAQFCKQARLLGAQRQASIAAIDSRPALLARGRRVRRALRAAAGLGRLPARTPLRPRVKAGPDGQCYRLEHLIFESRPGFYVTANLFLPVTPPPYPAVLLLPGHHPLGKQYYAVPAALTLAAHGVAVLVTDPVGQGERDEYADRDGTRTVSRACRQHGAAGDPCYLPGGNFAAYRLWDSMRALDYLQSRPDILRRRIGAAGGSGGGWESLWLTAIDTRVRALASHCYLTTWLRRMENRGADAEPDPEQDPFGILAAGLEAADLLLACFPRPVTLGATTRDFFPIDGARACYREAAALYRLGGSPERIALTVADAGHAFVPKLRAAAYRWLLRWLADAPVTRVKEPAAQPFSQEQSRCTTTGCVRSALGGVTSAELNAREARALAEQRAARRAARSPRAWRREVRARLAALLHITLPRKPVRAREGVPRRVGKLLITPLSIVMADRFACPAWLWEARGAAPAPAVVLLREKGPDFRPERDPLARELARAGRVVLDFDPRGMGPQRTTWADFVPLEQANLSYDAFLLGESLPGLRTADVLDALAFLRTRPSVDAARLAVCGIGNAATPALFAGCLDTGVAHTIEADGLGSFSSLAWFREYAWPAQLIVPGVLRHLDLEDVRAACAPRQITFLTPRDHCRRPFSPRAAAREFAAVRAAYQALDASPLFRLHAKEPPLLGACLLSLLQHPPASTLKTP